MSYFVIADDLTSACEIAGVAHAEGKRASVVLDPALIEALISSGGPKENEVLVIDTDTRLGTAEMAASKLEAVGKSFRQLKGHHFFKKTDSVLRGPIRAELEALARTMYLSRILLVPSNPGLGRTISAGIYSIHGTPLNQTIFASDPYHPARSSDVRDLLSGAGELRVVSARADQPLAKGTLIVGDATCAEDLSAWARRSRQEHTFAAGSSAFFLECLRAQAALSPGEADHGDNTANENPVPQGTSSPERRGEKLLLISGTTVEGQKQLLREGSHVVALRHADLSNPSPWIQKVISRLRSHERAHVFFDEPVTEGLGREIGQAFASLAAEALNTGQVTHLVVEGGATAATIAQKLGWRVLSVIGQRIPGVVTLTPDIAPTLHFTVKPGSYPWPPRLLEPATQHPSPTNV